MTVPIELSFHNMDHSSAVAAKVNEKAAKLNDRFDRMTHCRVVVEAPHRHHRKGKLYKISIEIGLPNHQLLVNRDPAGHHAHEDIYVAIRDAFNAARRQLEDYTDKMARRVKIEKSF